MTSFKEITDRLGYILAVLMGLAFLIAGYFIGFLILMGFGIAVIILTVMIYINEQKKREID